MTKKICDYCGAEAHSSMTLGGDMSLGRGVTEKKCDLCRACFLKLEAFLKELKKP